MKKSVQRNMILNIMRTLLSVAFPLISYPYATRILHAENYGKVSFVNSIISYIALIAALGVSSYAIREGGFYRKDKDKFSIFANEVFSINLLSTVVAYIVLAVLLLFNEKMRSNSLLLIIMSLTVFLTTISVDWINVIFEDYFFITVRSFVIQCLSLIALFVFVKSPDDYYKYAMIQVANCGLIAVSNFIYTRKYSKVRPTLHINLSRHIKPIIILFSNSLAVTVYSNIDNVIIGFVKGEYFVGLYSVAVKVYTIMKQVVASVYSVTVTRLTDYLASDKIDEYKNLLNDVINTLILMAFPITAGIICTSREIVIILSGEEYVDASPALSILSVTILFAVIGGTLANCVNLPNKREKTNLIGTVISALINLGLNMIVIPYWGISGAALTTLIAEVFVCFFLIFTMRDLWYYFDKKGIIKNLAKCLISILPFFAYEFVLRTIVNLSGMRYFLIMVVLSAVTYIVMGMVLDNMYMKRIINSIVCKLTKRKKNT